jgi:hypothetical protein
MNSKLQSIPMAVLFAACLYGQEGPVRFGSVTTEKATVLKSHPKNSAATVRMIPTGTTLQWIEGQKKGNWVRVVLPKGPAGWVPAKMVTIVTQPPPPPATSEITLAAAKCEPNLDACTVNGCAAEGSAHALMNQAKRKFATGTPVTISFSDLAALQEAADSVVGQGQEIPDRSVLQNLQVGSNQMGEGTAVQLTAFLASNPPGPHPNTGESVNCNIRLPQNNDFHIPITEEANQTEFDGFVVEMIPQGANEGEKRDPGWSLDKLKRLQAAQRQVKVVGKLFYDNAHVINPDPQNPLQSQPKRFTLWEVHPISQFLVCKKTSGCDIDTDTDWTPLEKSK